MKGKARRGAGRGSMLPAALTLCAAVLQAGGTTALLIGGRSYSHQLTRASTRECFRKHDNGSDTWRLQTIAPPTSHVHHGPIVGLPEVHHDLFCRWCRVTSYLQLRVASFVRISRFSFTSVNHVAPSPRCCWRCTTLPLPPSHHGQKRITPSALEIEAWVIADALARKQHEVARLSRLGGLSTTDISRINPHDTPR